MDRLQIPIPHSLLEGYQRFRARRYPEHACRYRELFKGQYPKILILACADSRTDPALIFDAVPGDFFVVRNVANLVPPYHKSSSYHGTSAALEFAITSLQVTDFLVLGHHRCGGIAASFAQGEGKPVGDFIGPWIEIVTQAREKVLKELPDAPLEQLTHALELAAVQQSLKNLSGYPFIAQALKENRLGLHGGWFSIEDGALHWLDPENGTFSPLPEAQLTL